MLHLRGFHDFFQKSKIPKFCKKNRDRTNICNWSIRSIPTWKSRFRGADMEISISRFLKDSLRKSATYRLYIGFHDFFQKSKISKFCQKNRDRTNICNWSIRSIPTWKSRFRWSDMEISAISEKSLIFWIWSKSGILKMYTLRRELSRAATSSKSSLVKKFGSISPGTPLETGENGCTARHAFLDCGWISRFLLFWLFSPDVCMHTAGHHYDKKSSYVEIGQLIGNAPGGAMSQNYDVCVNLFQQEITPSYLLNLIAIIKTLVPFDQKVSLKFVVDSSGKTTFENQTFSKKKALKILRHFFSFVGNRENP